MELRGRTKNDVLFWFAQGHSKHPNMVDAILEATDYEGVEVHVTLSGVKYEVSLEDSCHGKETTYKIATVT